MGFRIFSCQLSKKFVILLYAIFVWSIWKKTAKNVCHDELRIRVDRNMLDAYLYFRLVVNRLDNRSSHRLLLFISYHQAYNHLLTSLARPDRVQADCLSTRGQSRDASSGHQKACPCAHCSDAPDPAATRCALSANRVDNYGMFGLRQGHAQPTKFSLCALVTPKPSFKCAAKSIISPTISWGRSRSS